MSASSTDYFTEVGNPGTATTLAAPGHSIAGNAINITSSSNWPTNTGAVFAMDTYDVSTGKRVPGSYTEWEGVIGTNAISAMVLRYGTDQNYSAGSTTRVYIPVSSSRENRIVQGILLHANQDGSLKTSAVQAALGLTNLNGYTPVGFAPNTVVCNGNRSYTLTFNSVDLTTFLNPGVRFQTTRTVAAPNQCASLNGTSQYFVKTSPNKLSFTDDFVVSAWVKVTQYGSTSVIASRYNGTSGWEFYLSSSGQPTLIGRNAGSANFSQVVGNQSIPLNKWVHITAQLDMSSFTATPTTSYVMLDGVDVPCTVGRAGTNPTALVQAGNLEIGSENGGTNLFPGKIAQVAIFSAKVTQATIRGYISQGLAGSETSLDTAFSLSNSANDLNATTPNNLSVGGGSATTTNADAPFGGQSGGSISTTLDYAIIQSISFSTNTTVVVQVPEGCTIPTSGGVASVVYSANKAPYGFPTQRAKWRLMAVMFGAQVSIGTLIGGVWYNPGSLQLNTPVGEWIHTYKLPAQANGTGGTNATVSSTLSTSNSAETNNLFTTYAEVDGANPGFAAALYASDTNSVSTMAPYYALLKITTNTATTLITLRGDTAALVLSAENAYL